MNKILLYILIFLLCLLAVLTAYYFYLDIPLAKQQKQTEIQQISPTSTPSVTQTTTQPPTVSCPVPDSLCKKGILAELNMPDGKKVYEGIEWDLPENTALLASFDGVFTMRDTVGAQPVLRLISLTSLEDSYEARYFFTPANKLSPVEEEVFAKGIQVKKGAALSILPELTAKQKVANTTGNFKFQVIDKKNNNSYVKLSPSDL